MRNGGFSAQVAIFNKDAMAAVDKTRKAITAEFLGHVILGSPVDEGRFAGNWRFGKGYPVTTTIDRLDPGKQAVMGEMLQGVAASPAEGTVYLNNNLPYAMKLEYGHSGQAPEGMVRIAKARLPEIIRKLIEENRI